MMEKIVIVAYRPKPGKSEALKELMERHWSMLNNEGLVSDRKSIIMESADQTIIEVFGWKSKEAMEEAHNNPTVQKMWGEYSEVCDYVPLNSIPESTQIFAEFNPIN